MDNKNPSESLAKLYNSLSSSQQRIAESMNREWATAIIQSTNIIAGMNKKYADALGAICSSIVLPKSTIDSISKVQLSLMKSLPTANITPLTSALKVASINMNYSPVIEVLNNSFKNERFLASDLALLKKTNLLNSLGSDITIPPGLTSVIKNINIPTANMLIKNNDIEFDATTKMFFYSSDEGITEASTSEFNAICSATNMLNEIGEGNNDEIVNEKELADFMTYLFEQPTMGMMDKTGQKIHNMISNIWLDSNSANKIGFDEEYYFHSRKREADQAPFVYSEMLKAPTGISGPGRYNHAGRGHYYFSNTKYGAESEIKKHSRGDYEIQTIKVKPVKEIRMLDLSGTVNKGKTFLKYLRFPVSEINSNMPREYLIPSFVADCCKNIGFEGIKYKGGKDSFNYVSWKDGYFDFVENA